MVSTDTPINSETESGAEGTRTVPYAHAWEVDVLKTILEMRD